MSGGARPQPSPNRLNGPAGLGSGPLSDQAFLASFEARTLPPAQFHHADHVRLARLMLLGASLPEALRRFCEGLRRFAAALGKSGLYHETITVAYLLLIHERMDGGGAGASFAEFAAENPDLLSWRPSVPSAITQRRPWLQSARGAASSFPTGWPPRADTLGESTRSWDNRRP